MPEDHCGQEHTNADLDQTDETELADAYAALEEDRRQRDSLGATRADTAACAGVATAGDPAVELDEEGVANADDSAITPSTSGEPTATEAPEQPRRRVF